MTDNAVKRNIKDGVFTSLFSDPKYVLELYKVLYPEDNDVSEDMIEIITIQRIFMNGQYNDLGFKVKDKLIILAEAQSTWTENVVLRMMYYSVYTYWEYLVHKEFNFYGTKKPHLPIPGLYVIYTGDKEISGESVSLAENFFGIKDADMNFKVHIIRSAEKNNIVYQYITFTKVLDGQVKKYGKTAEAVMNTIKICRDENILKEYLSKHEQEVHDIMFELFDQQKVWEIGMKEAAKEAAEELHEEWKTEFMEEAKEKLRNELIAEFKEEEKEKLRDEWITEFKEEAKAAIITEGVRSGRESILRKVALNMLKQKQTDEYIMNTLGISYAELKNLKKRILRRNVKIKTKKAGE